MSQLDINTPLGQITLSQERRAIAIFERRHPNYRYIHTPKDEPADFDGVLVKDDTIKGIVAVSCRNCSIERFRTSFGNSWLLTFEKVIKGYTMARACCVPLYGFLYLNESRCLLVKRFWSPSERWNIAFNVSKTETQATVNGGTATRDNAYIDMTDVVPLFEDAP